MSCIECESGGWANMGVFKQTYTASTQTSKRQPSVVWHWPDWMNASPKVQQQQLRGARQSHIWHHVSTAVQGLQAPETVFGNRGHIYGQHGHRSCKHLWYVFSLEVWSLSHVRDLRYQKKLRFNRSTPPLSTSSSSATVAPVACSRRGWAGNLVPNDAKPLSTKFLLLQRKQLQSLLSHLRICCLSTLMMICILHWWLGQRCCLGHKLIKQVLT